MANARDEMLRRIRSSLVDVSSKESAVVSVKRDYLLRDPAPHEALIHQFAERVEEYKAKVHRITPEELRLTIKVALQAQGVTRLVFPHDAPAEWLAEGITPLYDQSQLSHADLEMSDGVITGCAIGVAQTGTIILDHGPAQGRRAISLIPDYHLCIVYAEQIVGLVPEAISRLEPSVQLQRPITFISGPSATSDIELNRVEVVHGPRTLEVLIVT